MRIFFKELLQWFLSIQQTTPILLLFTMAMIYKYCVLFLGKPFTTLLTKIFQITDLRKYKKDILNLAFIKYVSYRFFIVFFAFRISKNLLFCYFNASNPILLHIDIFIHILFIK